MDIKRYYLLYRQYLGSQINFVLIGSIIVGLLESLSIITVLPLLDSFASTENINLFPNNSQTGWFQSKYQSLVETLDLRNLFIIIILLFLLKGILHFILLVYIGHLRGILLERVKIALYNVYKDLSFEQYNSIGIGTIINAINEQSSKILQGFQLFSLSIFQLINGFVFFVVALISDYTAAIILLVSGFVLIQIFKIFNTTIALTSKIISADSQIIATYVIDIFRSFKYLSITNQFKKFDHQIASKISKLRFGYFKISKFQAFTMSMKEPLALLAIMLSFYFLFFYLGKNFAILIVMFLLFYRSLTSLGRFQSQWQKCMEWSGSLIYIDDQLRDMSMSIYDHKEDPILEIEKIHTFELLSVTYRYPGSSLCAVDNLSYTFNSGKIYGVVGPSGAGKSTMIDIIGLLIMPTSGELRINGQELTAGYKEKVGYRIGYVPQEPQVFNGTLYQNITLDFSNTPPKDESVDQVMKCLEMVALAENGKSFRPLFEEYSNPSDGISGGQKQRVALARELFRSVDVLILDEFTSALDAKTQDQMMKVVQKIKHEKIIITISHRDETFHYHDERITIKDGQIVR